MVKKLVTTMITVAVITATVIISCNLNVHKVELTGTVKINEDSAVIHQPPIVMNIINDSILGFAPSPLYYCLYNYRTGKTVKKFYIDTASLKKSVAIARHVDKKDYKEVGIKDAGVIGVSPYEIINFHTDNSDTSYVFFNVMTVREDTVTQNGKNDSAKIYQRIICIGTFNLKNLNFYKIYYIDNRDSIFSSAYSGVGKKGNLFFTGNSAPYNKIVTMIHANDSMYIVHNAIIPDDTIAQTLRKKHQFQWVTFFSNSDDDLTICDGNK